MQKTSALILSLLFAGTANATFITNGSLTGDLAINAVPSDWSISSVSTASSPDTNDVNNALGGAIPYTATASDSPDGGTWVGIARGDDYGLSVFGVPFIESFGQDVIGLTIGTQYELTWYNAHYGADNEEDGAPGELFDSDNRVQALIDGSSIGMGSLLTIGTDWVSESIIFTATAESHRLDFQLGVEMTGTQQAYLQIDGASLTEYDDGDNGDGPSVPIPAPLALMGLGLLGLGWNQRSKD